MAGWPWYSDAMGNPTMVAPADTNPAIQTTVQGIGLQSGYLTGTAQPTSVAPTAASLPWYRRAWNATVGWLGGSPQYSAAAGAGAPGSALPAYGPDAPPPIFGTADPTQANGDFPPTVAGDPRATGARQPSILERMGKSIGKTLGNIIGPTTDKVTGLLVVVVIGAVALMIFALAWTRR
jgi:hypothetical protein